MTTSALLGHAPADARFVSRVSKDLSAHGYTPIPLAVDKAGRSRPEMMDALLAVGRYFLYLVSEATVASSRARKLLASALEHEAETGSVQIIPLLLDNATIPRVLTLRSPVDFRSSYSEGAQRLIERMRSFHTRQEVLQSHSLSFVLQAQRFEEDLKGLLDQHRKALLSLPAHDIGEHFADILTQGGYFSQLTFHQLDAGTDVMTYCGLLRDEHPLLVQLKKHAADLRFEVVGSLFAAGFDALAGRARLATTSFYTTSLDWKEGRRWRGSNQCVFEMEWSVWRDVYSWLSAAPHLGEPLGWPIEQAHERYSFLVSKRFISGLGEGEESEIDKIAELLDEAEAPFYENAISKIEERERSLASGS